MQDKSVEKLFKEQVEHYSQEDRVKESYALPLVLEWIKKKKFKRKAEICEFGGGAGQLLNEIRKSYPNVNLINVEIIPDYKRYMVSKKIKYVVSSVLDSKFPDNSLDVILVRDVLHHLVGRDLKETTENQRHALNELNRLIRPGGAIFIEELTDSSEVVCTLLYYLTRINSRIGLRFLSFYVNPNVIVYFYTPKRLLQLYLEVFGEKNILIRKIDRYNTDLISRLLHFGKELNKVTVVLKKLELKPVK